MATITTILWSDLIKNSRQDINNNFENLNTDKLEDITWQSIWDLSDVDLSTAPTDWQAILYNSISWNFEPWDAWWWESAFDTATTTIDWSTSNNKEITITADTTLTQSNLPNWQTCYLKITNGWNFVITWADTIEWAWATAPTLTENWTDFIVFKKNATTIYADYWNDFTS